MMGGLQIEMLLSEIMGKWLDGSGWELKLTKAGVLSSNHVQDNSYIKRTCYSHQVTLVALHILREEAHTDLNKNENMRQNSWYTVHSWFADILHFIT